jgi:hypothetical protein
MIKVVNGKKKEVCKQIQKKRQDGRRKVDEKKQEDVKVRNK